MKKSMKSQQLQTGPKQKSSLRKIGRKQKQRVLTAVNASVGKSDVGGKKKRKLGRSSAAAGSDVVKTSVHGQTQNKMGGAQTAAGGDSGLVKSVEKVDRMFDELQKRIHGTSSLPPPDVSSSPGTLPAAAADGSVPLKKPRAERTAFRPAAAPPSTVPGSSGPAALGRRSRRRLRQLKRRQRALARGAAAGDGQDPRTKLQSARFRYINEQLYTSTGLQGLKLFRRDPEAFQAYHTGFSNQVAKWPVNPLDLIIKNVNGMPPSHVVVDLGCGEARLAASVRQRRVHSFDLVALNDRVTVCDMAHVPLPDGTANVVVLCLALMGTNLTDFVSEANRILKPGGQLRLAEVASRFDSVDQFVQAMSEYGFRFLSQDLSHKYFYLFRMKKAASLPADRRQLPEIPLKPCLYKRR